MSIRSFCLVLLFFIPIYGFSQPKIESAQGTKLNFGDAAQGARIEKKITIKNTGTAPLHISSVEAQCGCTATMMAKKELAPSESDDLTITFNTRGYNGKAIKHVYIKSDDPANPTFTIEFEANVTTTLTMNPMYVQFYNAKTDTTYAQSIAITNTSKNPLKILAVDTKVEFAKVSIMKNQLAPGEQTVLQLTFHPLRSGKYDGTVEITTDDQSNPKADIRFFGMVTNTTLMMNPTFVQVYNAKKDTTYAESVTITNTSKNPIKILSVQTKIESGSSSLMKNQLAPGEQTVLQLTFRPMRSGKFDGVIELSTDDASTPKAEVKFIGMVK